MKPGEDPYEGLVEPVAVETETPAVTPENDPYAGMIVPFTAIETPAPVSPEPFQPADFLTWKGDRDAGRAKSGWQKTKAFGSGVVQGGTDLLKTIWAGVSEIPSSFAHPIKTYRTYKEAATRGTVDMIQLLDNLRGAAGDQLVDQDEEDRREYDRYRTNLAFAKVRDQGMVYAPDKVYPGMAESLSNVLDPTIVIPFVKAGSVPVKVALRTGMKELALKSAKVAQLGSKVAGAVEVAASVPRRLVEGTLKATDRLTPEALRVVRPTYRAAAAFSGIPVVQGAARTEIAAQVAKGANDVAATMLEGAGSNTRKMRFLQKVATDPEVLKKSPNLARLAAFAHTHGGTETIDATFNAIADGLQIGVPQMALILASGGDAGDAGRGFGGALVMGAGTSLLTGKPGAGASKEMRDAGSIDHYVRTVGEDVQTSGFKKLPKNDQVLIAAMNEVGLPVKVSVLEPGPYKELAKARGADGTEGFYDKQRGEMFINAAAPSGKSNVALHESGHVVTSDLIKNDPLSVREVLNLYADPAGMEMKLRDGTKIKVNKEAQNFLADYNGKNPAVQITTGEQLAGEIGAEQWGYLMGSGKDLFELGQNKRVLGSVVEAGHTVLSKLGLVDRQSGAPVTDYNPISKRLAGNPDVQRLLSNYIKARRDLTDWQEKIQERGAEIRPKTGQSTEDAIHAIDGRAQVMPREQLRRADPQLVSKAITDFEAKNPPKPGEVRSGKGGEGHLLSPDMMKHLEWHQRAPKLMQMVNTMESAMSRGGKLAFYYSKRVDAKGNNPVSYYEATPYAFYLSKQGNISIKAWDEGAMQTAVARLVDRKLINDPVQFMNDIRAASDRQRKGEKIGDPRIAAVLGAEPDRIVDPAWRSVAEEMRKKGVIRQFRLDTIQGYSDLGIDGLAFRWPDVRIANRPAFPSRPGQGSNVPSLPK